MDPTDFRSIGLRLRMCIVARAYLQASNSIGLTANKPFVCPLRTVSTDGLNAETPRPKETVDTKAQPNQADEQGAPCAKEDGAAQQGQQAQQELDVSEKPSPKAKAQTGKKDRKLAVESKVSLQARQPAASEHIVPKPLGSESEATGREKAKAETDGAQAKQPSAKEALSPTQGNADEKAEQQGVGQGDARGEHVEPKEEREVTEGKEKPWRFAKTRSLPLVGADEKSSKHGEQSLEGEAAAGSPRSVEEARECKRREGSTTSFRSSRSSRSPRASDSQAAVERFCSPLNFHSVLIASRIALRVSLSVALSIALSIALSNALSFAWITLGSWSIAGRADHPDSVHTRLGRCTHWLCC